MHKQITNECNEWCGALSCFTRGLIRGFIRGPRVLGISFNATWYPLQKSRGPRGRGL